EELGFVGVCFLLTAFCTIAIRGMRAAFRAPDQYGTYLATGATLFVSVQALTNFAVTLGMLPTKGLVLPFISYAGSSPLRNCSALGIVLSVSRGSSEKPYKGAT